jgi:hypothetical protein
MIPSMIILNQLKDNLSAAKTAASVELLGLSLRLSKLSRLHQPKPTNTLQPTNTRKCNLMRINQCGNKNG